MVWFLKRVKCQSDIFDYVRVTRSSKYDSSFQTVASVSPGTYIRNVNYQALSQTSWIRNSEPYLISILLTKIKLKWIEDLNVRPETIKLLEENLGKILIDMGLGSDFLNMTLKSQATIQR